MPSTKYEIIDHTADIGIRLSAADLESVFLFAAEAMFEVMVDSKKDLIPAISVSISIRTDITTADTIKPIESLFVKWLQELLYIFDTRHLVPTHFFIDEISENKLTGLVKGLKFDNIKHKMKNQIKAVTYHHLKLEKVNDAWRAEVIFDI